MTGTGEKQALHRYLRNARGVLLWKVEGLSGYGIRRPVTPAGTNLPGLVKRCAGVECGYLGAVTGRPFPGEDDLDWQDGDDGELGGDMYATAAGSREQVTDFCRRVQAHSDATTGELPLDACGTVPWWPGEVRRHPALHTLLVHTIQETARHAGHADIIRESIDGAAGLREGCQRYARRGRRRRLEAALRQAGPDRAVRTLGPGCGASARRDGQKE